RPQRGAGAARRVVQRRGRRLVHAGLSRNLIMEQTWRWFGPKDPIPLNHVRQAGATGIVTALHHVPAGQAWPVEEIAKRQQAIEAAGMRWSVVESIPVPESIKLRTGSVESDIQAWKTSLARCGQAGIRTVCYNFMPVVDWTRTDL